MLIEKHWGKVHKKYKKRAKQCIKKGPQNNMYKNVEPKNSIKHMKQSSLNILTGNAAGLKHKASDLKDKIRHFKSTIFSVQETHSAKKGKFMIENYIVFEAIRKSKKRGGPCLAFMWT